MKNIYKFLSIIILISIIFFIVFYIYFYNPAKNKSNKPLNELNTQTPIETDELKNDSSVYVEDYLNFSESYNTSNLDKDDWKLIWADEFENNYLDAANWNIEDWAAEKNKELQYYSPDNIQVEDGILKLISKNNKFKGRNYTSGAIHTKGKFSFLYGKAEIRAKLPSGQGIFPAFWMMPDKDDTWLPEIDIMEMLGHQPNEIWMVSHWLDKDGNLKSDSSTFKGPNYSEDFHIFSVEWTPDSITWFIDDVERFKTSMYIPREKMYLYLNTAVGGVWPGSPDHTTPFPVSYEIDYVRVFKSNK